MEKEIWKDIPQYEGVYQVSNLGRVRSLDREVVNSNGIVRSLKGKVMSQSTSGGYLQVGLNGKKCKRVHQIVAMAFLGHVPNGHVLVVDHIDENKLNNNLNNLRIVSNRENLSRRGGSSKYVGVTWCKPNKKWRAQININGRIKNLGNFKNEIDAHNTYQKKLKEISK